MPSTSRKAQQMPTATKVRRICPRAGGPLLFSHSGGLQGPPANPQSEGDPEFLQGHKNIFFSILIKSQQSLYLFDY